MVAFGRPVVPDVNASSATSSAAVSHAANSAGFVAVRAARSLKVVCPPMSASTRSATNRSSTSEWSIQAISWLVFSSDVRSSGIVVTTTPPMRSTPSQQATSHGLFGARSSTRLPGTRPTSSTR